MKSPRVLILVNEKTGEEIPVQILDTPLLRYTSGLFEACRAYMLDRDERMAMALWSMGTTEEVPAKHLPPFVLNGFRKLAARGWFERKRGWIYMLRNEETGAITKAAEIAVHFNEDTETVGGVQ